MPAASCRTAVERAGLRQPSQPSASAATVTVFVENARHAHQPLRRRNPSQPPEARRRSRRACARCGCASSHLTFAGRTRPQARGATGLRHIVDAHDLDAALAADHRRQPGQPGKPAQHCACRHGPRARARAPGAGSPSRDRAVARCASASRLAAGEFGRPVRARRRWPRRGPRGAYRPARRPRTARVVASTCTRRTSSRAPSCSTPTQFTTASMPASSGSQRLRVVSRAKSASTQRA